ncbi:uncharacterized protein EI90DRAFT_557967 [Cantharellus anzutake]|uniref:uncharacterized protein n=1 Tax=Cantharellus anzutake TaxID=1750568 RepID=UPI001903ED3E|nr:uncharacterized protein EI90DRAFT_557967 [Cantharellus anzutake]KAF8313347.1 hypothetical protein EI90DRAFT_557967 [Cantharellus anzutake]
MPRRYKPVKAPVSTSPVKSRPYNYNKPKKHGDLLNPQPARYPEFSMSNVHASARDNTAPQPSRRVEIATSGGSVVTQRWGPGIQSTHRWQVPNRHDHVGSAMLACTDNISTPPSPQAPKMESLIWEESPHSWLENVAEATIPGSDTPSSPSPPPSAPKKRNKRASRNPQKQAAWLHWRENVIYKAVGIYLDLEAKKAGRISLGTPGETLFDENGCLCTPIASLCSRCNTYLRFHSLMTITSSSTLVSWLL